MEENSDSVLRTYFLNTSFHGFRFLADRKKHWTEKLFWIICCILSWIGTGLLLKATWDDYQNNAIQFVTETSYLDWNTSFPSLTVCESDNQDNIANVTDTLYGDPHDYNLDEIVKELVYFRGLSFYTLQMCGPDAPPNESCDLKNLTMFSHLVRSTCSQILQKCMWNNVEFECCDYFNPMDTELGTCYSINSRQTKNESVPYLEMNSNRKTGPGRFYIEIVGYANMYIQGEQEVPSLTSSQTDVLQISPNIHHRRFIGITEIENQPEVVDVAIRQRNCRFMEESYLDVYKYYSYTACTVQCRKDAQLSNCNCAHHLMPNSDQKKHCNISGLDCLSQHYNDLAVLKAHWSKRSGLICYCVPSCTEIEMTIIKDDKIGIEDEHAVVEIILERLPTERFKRNVVKGKLDLVVSMGGTAALFIGASILSFVEIIFYFIVRPTSNHCTKKEEVIVKRITAPIWK